MEPQSARKPAPAGWKTMYEPAELVTVRCPACDSGDSRRVAREFGIEIARCVECGLTFTRTPRASSQEHYLVSEQAFLTKYGAIFEGAPHSRHANYEEHLRTLERYAPGRKLLDVGSHAGFFLRRARDRGWDVNGVELSPTTARLARERFGLEVTTGTISTADIPDQQFDAVTFIDVFEHISTPRETLAAVRRVLRPGGIVFIKVPNVRYVRAKHRTLGLLAGARNDIYDAREHLVFYSARTLTRVVEDAGFGVELLMVPLPIQAGGAFRRAVRAGATGLARRLPRGVELPLATDLALVGRR